MKPTSETQTHDAPQADFAVGPGSLAEERPSDAPPSQGRPSTVASAPLIDPLWSSRDPSHRPQGAIRQPDGSVLWRVWAPRSERVTLVTFAGKDRQEIPMTDEDFGYFVYRAERAPDGLRYKYKLADGREYPDPASRWQPDGVHDASAVFLPDRFAWSDRGWRGVPHQDLVLYELHVGAFTPEGTFDAIIRRLPELRALGITALELMPIAQFPGARNWGYDGVYPYAAQNSYGGPRGLERLVNAAHRAGLAVLLDVVYNHFGPEGCYVSLFGPYFTDRHQTAWGPAVNYDGPDSDPVRQFAIDNACQWVRDFHVDGLRLDAVHAIYDLGARHILAEIQAAVQEEAQRAGRIVNVIAESNQNDVRLIQPVDRGGYGLDGVWDDDFHHSVHTLLTGERDGYFRDFGGPEHLAKVFNQAFVYDGSYSPYRRRRYGSPVGDLDRSRFVVAIQNHDQIGNRVRGDRVKTSLPAEAQRLAAALMLVSPYMPMLFMGEEYADTSPFPFFCSFGDPQLVEAVRNGRREEFAALEFQWGTEIPDPQDPATFNSAKLSWQWPEGSFASRMRQLYGDLLRARRRWGALRDRQHTRALLASGDRRDGEEGPGAVLVLERGAGDCLIALANLTSIEQPLPPWDLAGRDLIFSTEAKCYGGRRRDNESAGMLFPYELLVFGRSEWLQ